MSDGWAGEGKEKETDTEVKSPALKDLLSTLSNHVTTLNCKAKGYRRAERDAKTAAEIYEMEAMELEMKVDELKGKMGGYR